MYPNIFLPALISLDISFDEQILLQGSYVCTMHPLRTFYFRRNLSFLDQLKAFQGCWFFVSRKKESSLLRSLTISKKIRNKENQVKRKRYEKKNFLLYLLLHAVIPSANENKNCNIFHKGKMLKRSKILACNILHFPKSIMNHKYKTGYQSIVVKQ